MITQLLQRWHNRYRTTEDADEERARPKDQDRMLQRVRDRIEALLGDSLDPTHGSCLGWPAVQKRFIRARRNTANRMASVIHRRRIPRSAQSSASVTGCLSSDRQDLGRRPRCWSLPVSCSTRRTKTRSNRCRWCSTCPRGPAPAAACRLAGRGGAPQLTRMLRLTGDSSLLVAASDAERLRGPLNAPGHRLRKD
jgi:hypothetical protein